MGWHETCSYCGEISRYACSRHDSKRDCDMEIMKCPNADREEKLWALQRLGFDTDWIEDGDSEGG